MKNKTLFLAWLIVGVMLSIGLPVLAAPPYDGGAGDGFSVSVTTYQFTGDAVSIESSADQTPLGRGALPTEASMITIKQSSNTGITAVKDIRIRIPSELKLIWDTSVTTASIYNIKNEYSSLSATRAKVATTQPSPNNTTAIISYADAGKTLLVDVTTDFDMGDTLRIRGLRFMNFDAYSSGKLKLDILGSVSGYQYLDLRYKTIGEPYVYGDGWATNESNERYFNNPPRITAPVSTDRIGVGDAPYVISWTTAGFSSSSATLHLEYWTAASGQWNAITGAENLSVTAGSFSWTLPLAIDLGTAKVRFVENTNPDITNESAEFKIVGKLVWDNASITGTPWRNKVSHSFKWNTTGKIGSVKVEYLRSAVPVVLSTSLTNTANGVTSSSWTPQIASDNVFLRVSDLGSYDSTGNLTVFADSPSFSIAGLQLLSPRGGEEWELETGHNISWESAGFLNTDSVIIQYSKDSGTSWQEIANNQTVSSGAYNWSTSDLNDVSNNVLIKVYTNAITTRVSDVLTTPVKIVRKPKIEITAPIAAPKESLQGGSPYTITWNAIGRLSSKVKLSYSTNNGTSWTTVTKDDGALASSVDTVAVGTTSGSCSWKVPVIENTNVLLKIEEVSVPANRDTTSKVIGQTVCSITKPIINISYPVLLPTGEADIWWVGDTQRNIQWSSTGEISNNFSLAYSLNGGAWQSILDSTLDGSGSLISGVTYNASTKTGSYIWAAIAPGAISEDAGIVRIRVKDNNSPNAEGVSDPFKIISRPRITVTEPHKDLDAETYLSIGDPFNIQWKVDGQISGHKVMIEYSSTGDFSDPAKVVKITKNLQSGIDAPTDNDGYYTWSKVDNITSDNVKIRIRDTETGYDDIVGISDRFNIIPPSIQLDLADFGTPVKAYANGEYEVKWTKAGEINPLTIEYLNKSGTWKVMKDKNLADAILVPADNNYANTNSGSFFWKVPDDAIGSNCKIRITDPVRGTNAVLATAFSVVAPSIELTAPLTGDSWVVGTPRIITWKATGTHNSVPNNLTLQYYDVKLKVFVNIDTTGINYGSPDANAIANGSCPWNVVNAVSLANAAKIKIFDPSRSLTTSTVNFTINSPQINITSPAGTENGENGWLIGSVHTITWATEGDVSAVLNFYYSIEAGADGTYTEIPSGQIANIVTNSDPVNVTGTGSADWIIPDALSSSCKIKIEAAADANHALATGVSKDVFSIVAAKITLTRPNDPNPNNNVFTVGDNETITWDVEGSLSGDLEVQYLLSGTSQWVPITTVTKQPPLNAPPYKRSYSCVWPIDASLRTADQPRIPASIRVRDKNRPNDSTRSIAITLAPQPIITITSPNGGGADPNNREKWKVGTTNHVIIWATNAGVFTNNLALAYTKDTDLATAQWIPVAAGGVNNIGTFPWNPIPDDISQTVRVKITDLDGKSTMRQPTTDLSDNYFEIIAPTITISSPIGGDYWAMGDAAPITWATEGTVNDYLVFSYYDSNTDGWTVFANNQKNDGNLSWSVPTGILPCDAKVKIVDSQRSALTFAESNIFHIISVPEIKILAPTGGQYEIGDTANITWNSKGLSIGKLNIEYSLDDFKSATPVYNLLPAGVEVDGSISKRDQDGNITYSWLIPADVKTGNDIKIRISDKNRPNDIKDISPSFMIKGGFSISNPKPGEIWGAKSPQTISWAPKSTGAIPRVKLEYSLMQANGIWSSPAQLIATVDNATNYPWTVVDAQDTLCRLTISDLDDPTLVKQVEFKIDYYTINWNITDYEDYHYISGLTVKDEYWKPTETVDSPVSHKYPYGTYTTYWSKSSGGTIEYPERSLTWTPAKNDMIQTFGLALESSSSLSTELHVQLSTSYSAATDRLEAMWWLEKKGRLFGATNTVEELPKLGKGVLDIYDRNSTTPDVSIKTMAISQPDNNGTYGFAWDNTGLVGGKTYFVKATIYKGEPNTGAGDPDLNRKAVSSGANIDVTAAKTQAEETKTITEAIVGAQGIITGAIGITESNIKTAIGTTETNIKTAITTAETNITGQTSQILTATGTTLPAQIAAVQEMVVKEIKPSVQSGILNRETSIKTGSSMTISYRTTTGLAPVVSVYDPKNVLKIASKTMKEIGSTGVYEYEVKFENGWGIGDFTVVCSESTQGTADALAISVVRHDLEEISGQVSGVLGTTAGLTGLGDVVDTLNSQFAVIDKALTGLSQGVVGKVEQTKGVVNDLESVYNQLTALSGQIKKIGGTQGLSLEKLYQVSKDKKDDITYLKNKAQELKATMEINQKMMKNVANKPVVQSWFEFK